MDIHWAISQRMFNDSGALNYIHRVLHCAFRTFSVVHEWALSWCIFYECSAHDWRYAAKQFLRRYPQDVLVHCEFYFDEPCSFYLLYLCFCNKLSLDVKRKWCSRVGDSYPVSFRYSCHIGPSFLT